MKRSKMISSVIAVLAVLVFTGSFRANLAYAEFPPSPYANLFQKDSTGSDPSLDITFSATQPSVLTGYYSICNLNSPIDNAPLLVADTKSGDADEHYWTITGKVVNSTTLVYKYDFFQEFLAPMATVSFYSWDTFPTGAACQNAATWASGPAPKIEAAYLKFFGHDIGPFSDTKFWLDQNTGTTPSSSFTLSSTQPALVQSIDFFCTTSSAVTSAPALKASYLSSGLAANYAVNPLLVNPNTILWQTGPLAAPVDPNAPVTITPYSSLASPADCWNLATGVVGPAAQINALGLSNYGISGLGLNQTAYGTWTQASTGSSPSFAFTVSPTESAIVGKANIICNTVSPVSDAPVLTASIPFGGSTTAYPFLGQVIGTNTLVYRGGPFGSPLNPRAAFTIGTLAPFPDATCSMVATGVWGPALGINNLLVGGTSWGY
jgi:hypothetical protein